MKERLSSTPFHENCRSKITLVFSLCFHRQFIRTFLVYTLLNYPHQKFALKLLFDPHSFLSFKVRIILRVLKPQQEIFASVESESVSNTPQVNNVSFRLSFYSHLWKNKCAFSGERKCSPKECLSWARCVILDLCSLVRVQNTRIRFVIMSHTL